MESALDHEQKMHDEMRTKEAGTAKELMLTQTELSECQVTNGGVLPLQYLLPPLTQLSPCE